MRFHFQAHELKNALYWTFSEDVSDWYERNKGKALFNVDALREEGLIEETQETPVQEESPQQNEGTESNGTAPQPKKKTPKPLDYSKFKLFGKWAFIKQPPTVDDFVQAVPKDAFTTESPYHKHFAQNATLPLDWNLLQVLTGVSQAQLANMLELTLGTQRYANIDPFNHMEFFKLEPGDGFSWTRDSHLEYGSTTVVLTLQGEIISEMLSELDGRHKTVLQTEHSALVLDLEYQWAWKRRIKALFEEMRSGQPVKRQTHFSILLRHKRDNTQTAETEDSTIPPCKCSYDENVCEVKQKIHQERIAKMTPEQLEVHYVKNVYDAIAEHWDHTRHTPWNHTVQFLEGLPDGAYVGDIGCGNGRNMLINPRIKMEGCDISTRLVEICKQKGLNAIFGDAKHVPFEDQQFDHVISVAVLHHFSTEAHRVQALHELYRVVKPGGRIFVCAWALEQDETSKRDFDTEQQDVMVPWNMQQQFIKMREENLKDNEEELQQVQATYRSETKIEDETHELPQRIVYQRFCHLFKKGELERLWSVAVPEEGAIEIEDVIYDCSNWCTVVKRLK